MPVRKAGFFFWENFIMARAFGIRRRRNGGRWLVAGLLMAATVLVLAPRADTAEEVPGYNAGTTGIPINERAG